MKMNNFTTKRTKFKLDKGEEFLGKELPVLSQEGNRSMSFLVGCDNGSTQVRTYLLTNEDFEEIVGREDEDPVLLLSNYLTVIPSKQKYISSEEIIPTLGSTMYENMETTQVSMSGMTRILRAALSQTVESVELELLGGEQKIASPLTYSNIVDGIGYSIINYCNKKSLPVPVIANVDIGVSLPVEDMTEKSISIFKGKLQNTTWEFNGVKIEIRFGTKDVISEPEANIKGYGVFADPSAETIVHFEGGGRNSGVIRLAQGNILGKPKNLNSSGNALISLVQEAIVNERGGKEPNFTLVREALTTGKLRTGASERDEVNNIMACKSKLAINIYQEALKELSGATGFDWQDIELVTFGGRLFDNGDYGFSIASELSNMIKKKSPHTETVLLDTNYVPLGALLGLLSE